MKKLIEGASRLGITLDAGQIERFEIYYHELISWNKKINLTAITDYQEVQIKHFLDSLTVTLALTAEELARPEFCLIDIGSGAGFPGIPLRLFLSRSRLVLVESRAKKAAFLHHIVERLGLSQVEVVAERAEEIARQPELREQFDLSLSRAVASLPAAVELALPFCRTWGKFVAQKKGEIEPEVSQAGKAIETLGGKLSQVKKIELDGEERYLVIIDKISSTPEKYPRRPGIPERRPIRGGE